MNKLDEWIGKYRTQIMGIAALGVVLGHSRDIVEWPAIINSIFGYGGIGVYIFVFLSAIGLYHSLKSRGRNYNKASFYKRRFARVIVPYCLIAMTWYGIQDLFLNKDILLFIYDVSTLSFWVEHKGAWYVAMLIPVYLLFPCFYDWAEKRKNIRIILTLVISVIFSFICSICIPDIYGHLAQVFSSVIVYLIGYLYAGFTKSNKNGLILSGICVILFLIKSMTPLKNFLFVTNITWAMLGFPITFISSWILDILHSNKVNTVLGFFGKHSLEMYLWNIFVIQAVFIFNIDDILKRTGDVYGFLTYGLVVMFGCLLSAVYGKLSEIVAKKLIGN
ncbi:acyltransferase family protein [Faecalitalea cylindroides]|uniref:acyltransferase family protein n=1 Tax=Faecalitalea cylindroides TaxID=39483 RepID=UPI00232F8878|nr:acyltransferase family protein [Faecalitalea cylindroides]MDB7951543.1 acyltransferase family protein [Faecalitalea cylindroides]MDB7958388.1 acyltransferase family protein [Faecalitalea cylindroides]MDB7960432.1 acyltransferase family protein [Faecalitalea cylindroides]MDB7962302.1 acyltransferase family protein [Faecalitalea cylindroides]MDB7964173.1 acyltransferase family protein [Faecalitalea cylindroides]